MVAASATLSGIITHTHSRITLQAGFLYFPWGNCVHWPKRRFKFFGRSVASDTLCNEWRIVGSKINNKNFKFASHKINFSAFSPAYRVRPILIKFIMSFSCFRCTCQMSVVAPRSPSLQLSLTCVKLRCFAYSASVPFNFSENRDNGLFILYNSISTYFSTRSPPSSS